MASLLTGPAPLAAPGPASRGQPVLSPALVTLPEALQARGYETVGFPGEPWYSKERFGFGQGFDAPDPARQGAEARASRLAEPGRRAAASCGSTCRSRGALLPAAELPAPARVGRATCPPHRGRTSSSPFFDPAVPLPLPGCGAGSGPCTASTSPGPTSGWATLLDGLRASGQWDRTLLVVTSDPRRGVRREGADPERRQPRPAAPRGAPGRSSCRPGSAAGSRSRPAQRVATARLWATLVEAAGGERRRRRVAPSLFRRGRGAHRAPRCSPSSTWATARTGSRWSRGTASSSGNRASRRRSRSTTGPPGPHEPRQRPRRPRRAVGAAGRHLPAPLTGLLPDASPDRSDRREATPR